MRNRERRRDPRREEDLFRHGSSQDSIPPIEDLIRATRRGANAARGRTRSRTLTEADFRIRHPVWLTVRFVAYGAVLLLGLVMTVGFCAGAVSHYADADTLAHAPSCARSVDLTTSSADCVGTLAMSYDYGTYPQGSEEYAIDLVPADATGTVNPSYSPAFPPSTEFADAAGDDGILDATFWQGRIVALTAGSGDGAVTVITDENPGYPAGTDVAVALFGASLTLFALLLAGAARAVRRWLPPGLPVQLPMTGIGIGMIGCFFTAIGLILQPERVLLAGIVGPIVTGSIVLLVWLLLYRLDRATRRRVMGTYLGG
ncbi:hypothetical protein KDL01_33255 [Actinospica durhamensis]|uniref:Uncharacterized protein n=1 Tax=Actinospica durhamensis TaxID=1508375 RepID=A0A941EXG6_9ACTN|nr:hypothetical protein [Actinospica durhamensis]MBR7838188.1 hypothetical protein [Actinospica durhamensis]